jgi:diguanylate cyclase (GGDEF)-like protein
MADSPFHDERPDSASTEPSRANGQATDSYRADAPAAARAGPEGGWLAEADQTTSEIDQTLSDTDHSAADSDQSSAERDQVASDSDQAASDHDLASGVNRAAYEFSRSERQRSTAEREQTAGDRLRTAEQRDAVAHLRDLAALARDQAATARDAAMARLDAAADQHAPARPPIGFELIARAAEDRKRAAQHRAEAANYRLLAAGDREAAAHDREQAARERHQALVDREALIVELERSAIDALTGARTRAAGLRELEQEVDRARRTGSPLSVAYIDLVGLKSVNDTLGHAAGDALIQHVVAHLKTHLRPYDLVVRLGGDEFLCVTPNLAEASTRERFAAIAAALASGPKPAAIRTGFAQLRDHETVGELIERADGELITTASNSSGSRPTPAEADP